MPVCGRLPFRLGAVAFGAGCVLTSIVHLNGELARHGDALFSSWAANGASRRRASRPGAAALRSLAERNLRAASAMGLSRRPVGRSHGDRAFDGGEQHLGDRSRRAGRHQPAAQWTAEPVGGGAAYARAFLEPCGRVHGAVAVGGVSGRAAVSRCRRALACLSRPTDWSAVHRGQQLGRRPDRRRGRTSAPMIAGRMPSGAAVDVVRAASTSTASAIAGVLLILAGLAAARRRSDE